MLRRLRFTMVPGWLMEVMGSTSTSSSSIPSSFSEGSCGTNGDEDGARVVESEDDTDEDQEEEESEEMAMISIGPCVRLLAWLATSSELLSDEESENAESESEELPRVEDELCQAA